MLIISIISLVVFIVSFVLGKKYTNIFDEMNYLSLFGAVSSSMVLLFTLLIWLLMWSSQVDNIQIYHMTKQTIENSRENNVSEIERASLINNIIEINSNLAISKYWNNTMFDDLYLDEYVNLEYLK